MSQCVYSDINGETCSRTGYLSIATKDGLKVFCNKHGIKYQSEQPIENFYPQKIYDVIDCNMQVPCSLLNDSCKKDEKLIMIQCYEKKIHKVHASCLEARINSSLTEDILCVICNLE